MGDKLASDERAYEVLLDGSDSSCTCPGNVFSGGCKHSGVAPFPRRRLHLTNGTTAAGVAFTLAAHWRDGP